MQMLSTVKTTCPTNTDTARYLQVLDRQLLLLLLMTFIGRKLRHAANAPLPEAQFQYSLKPTRWCYDLCYYLI